MFVERIKDRIYNLVAYNKSSCDIIKTEILDKLKTKLLIHGIEKSPKFITNEKPKVTVVKFSVDSSNYVFLYSELGGCILYDDKCGIYLEEFVPHMFSPTTWLTSYLNYTHVENQKCSGIYTHITFNCLKANNNKLYSYGVILFKTGTRYEDIYYSKSHLNIILGLETTHCMDKSNYPPHITDKHNNKKYFLSPCSRLLLPKSNLIYVNNMNFCDLKSVFYGYIYLCEDIVPYRCLNFSSVII
jgi:hypothetical protein